MWQGFMINLKHKGESQSLLYLRKEWSKTVRKILPIAGGVCGVLSGIGMICGAIWPMPKFVWVLVTAGFLALSAAVIYNLCQINKK